MAFNQQEQDIIKWGLQNGKTKDEVSNAITNYRAGIVPKKEVQPTTSPTPQEQNSFTQTAQGLKDINTSYQAGEVSLPEASYTVGGKLVGGVLSAPVEFAKKVPVLKEGVDLAGKALGATVGAGVQYAGENNPMAKELGNRLKGLYDEANKATQQAGDYYSMRNKATDPAQKAHYDMLAKSSEEVANSLRKSADGLDTTYKRSANVAEATGNYAALYTGEKIPAPPTTLKTDVINYGKTYDDAITSGDMAAKDVYSDPVTKTLVPSKAGQILNDVTDSFNRAGYSKLGSEIVNSVDKNNFTLDLLANTIDNKIAGLPKDVSSAITSGLKNIFTPAKDIGLGIKSNISTIKESLGSTAQGIKNIKIPESVKSTLGGRDSKLLSIFTGEDTDAINAALKDPTIADIGIQKGDVALRSAVDKGSQASIDARNAFNQSYNDALKSIGQDNKIPVTNRQKVLYQFVDDLNASGVKTKNGVLDFSTSKIVANPGEISKIKSAYEAIQNWKDFSFEGTNQLKQLIGKLTKFATEAGGSSKSPFLGKYYNYLDTEIKNALPETSRKLYTDINTKYSDNIGLYEGMVDAFNSGDPFTKLAQLFGKNKDSLRQIVDFYEQKTGNKISAIVAGRELAMEKSASFGFLNPRSWIDFFITPKLQAKIVTTYGKAKNQSLLEKNIKSPKSADINRGTPTERPYITTNKSNIDAMKGIIPQSDNKVIPGKSNKKGV